MSDEKQDGGENEAPKPKAAAKAKPAPKPKEARTVREVALELDNRIAEVMQAHGRRPGSLRAIQATVREHLRSKNPILDSTATPASDGRPLPVHNR